MNNKPAVILHGEAMIFQSQLPSNAKKIESSNKQYHVIADSEVTGNHHVVDCVEDTEFFMDENGTMYMKNSKPTQVRCLIKDRHTAIPLEAGTWEFGIQQEYNHIAQHARNARD
jgi:hypothetical protein